MMGTSLRITDGSADYIPDIPEKGYYAVYCLLSAAAVKIPRKCTRYRVNHAGGSTDFIVESGNGRRHMALSRALSFSMRAISASAGVSHCLGHDGSPVSLLMPSGFGGGMGNVARRPCSVSHSQPVVTQCRQPACSTGSIWSDSMSHSWKLSGKPRFLEGARYWLQYAGMPDTLVYSPNRGKNDYNDDYMSRAEWVNYLLARRPDSRNDGHWAFPLTSPLLSILMPG
ncbi:MAG: hypothetical protein MZV63_20905 [Marinilabiliales bacterium]|nr:hypothetical protein [Marinilabiliales bacterium]